MLVIHTEFMVTVPCFPNKNRNVRTIVYKISIITHLAVELELFICNLEMDSSVIFILYLAICLYSVLEQERFYMYSRDKINQILFVEMSICRVLQHKTHKKVILLTI